MRVLVHNYLCRKCRIGVTLAELRHPSPEPVLSPPTHICAGVVEVETQSCGVCGWRLIYDRSTDRTWDTLHGLTVMAAPLAFAMIFLSGLAGALLGLVGSLAVIAHRSRGARANAVASKRETLRRHGYLDEAP